ncbi:hypothetical protein A3K86_18330 [Photobacterium jeanii]|uniref:Flagellar Assembly Protein A N-terminal region domain-containing protein n=1 Tax=Photobacterium jeanii TaxID=858640 RepID=A0A178K0Z3_9GAMM|nr:FapA family protein [Photobacterium jeanii]OAN10941.1 hypothetical protein A3K86_18330 [Photobacterium jeanii]PST90457.1 DUF342 domain-containing protein [Photobacterium jeanii]
MALSLLKLSKDKNTISIHAQPLLEQETLVERGDIYQQLASLHGGSLFRYESAIDSAIAILNADKALEPQDIVIAEQRDASLIVKTTNNNMSASITVIGAYGGKDISGKALLAALKQNNIIKGIRKHLLQTLLAKSRWLKAGEKLTMQVALGRLPQNGENSRFKPLIVDVSHRVLKPKQLDHDKVDMRDLGELCSVSVGQSLMLRVPASAGVDGYNVLGESLPAKAGEDKLFNHYDGAAVSDYDPNILVATQSGVPIIKKNGVQVDDALVIKDVSPTIGHVEFDGSVVIKGDVKPGMKVTVSGAVTVLGFVEQAEIIAKGDITVMKGILGKQASTDEGYTCVIRTGGKLTSKFAQYVEVEAKDDISFSHHALHCKLTTKGKLTVLDDLKRYGTLSGGDINVGYSVHALTIGALAGTTTKITAFANYVELRQQIAATVRLFEQEKQQLATMKQAQFKLLKIPTDKRPPELVAKVVEQHKRHQQNLRHYKASYEQLREEYQQVLAQVSVTAVKCVHAGVSCQIEKHNRLLTSEHGPSVFSVRDNQLEMKPL